MSASSTPNAESAAYLTVDADLDGQRLDNFLLSRLKGAPKTLVYRIIRTGEVRVNKGRVKAEYRVKPGDVVRVPPLRLADPGTPPAPGAGLLRELAGRIVYEQDGLLVIDKPAGLAVHGGSGVPFGAVEAMRALRPDARFIELVHRIDKDTSGLLMLAEKRSLLKYLHEELREGRLHKVYVALLSGRLKGAEHEVRAPLKKTVQATGEHIVRVARDGKEACSIFRVIERLDNATLVEVQLMTGRTHQIRVHAQYLGHPLVGDEKYGNDAVNETMKAKGINRLFLHARDLGIRLPGQTDPLMLTCPLAAELTAALERLRG